MMKIKMIIYHKESCKVRENKHSNLKATSIFLAELNFIELSFLILAENVNKIHIKYSFPYDINVKEVPVMGFCINYA